MSPMLRERERFSDFCSSISKRANEAAKSLNVKKLTLTILADIIHWLILFPSMLLFLGLVFLFRRVVANIRIADVHIVIHYLQIKS